jgi:hypothetical protein
MNSDASGMNPGCVWDEFRCILNESRMQLGWI